MSVANLLSKLNDINNSNLVDVYVPSQGKTTKFKQLTAKQQKELIQTGLDGAIAGLTFNTAVNRIIVDNSVNHLNYTVSDRINIMTALRVAAFGPTFIDDNGVQHNLEVIASKQLPSIQPSTININELEVNVTTPTILLDTATNLYAIQEFKKVPDMEISNVVGLLYVYELAKHIANIKIVDEVVEFSKISVADRLKIVEKLPASVLNRVVEFIHAHRELENQLTTNNSHSITLDSRIFALD